MAFDTVRKPSTKPASAQEAEERRKQQQAHAPTTKSPEAAVPNHLRAQLGLPLHPEREKQEEPHSGIVEWGEILDQTVLERIVKTDWYQNNYKNSTDPAALQMELAAKIANNPRLKRCMSVEYLATITDSEDPNNVGKKSNIPPSTRMSGSCSTRRSRPQRPGPSTGEARTWT